MPRLSSSSIKVPEVARTNLQPTTLAPDQLSYLDKAKAFPLTFELPKAQSPQAWDRAKEFLQKYSTLRLQRADDRVIETDSAPAGDVDVAYVVARKPWTSELDHFSVETQTASRFGGSNANSKARTNSHLLAYYIATGTIDPNFVAK